jgi:hypothetical protein
MCMAIERECDCGKESARLHHVNGILPSETVKNIYCPSCSNVIAFNSGTMIEDNGWVIEYDMEIASLYARKMGTVKEGVTPEMIFDEGYCSWQGFTPNDLLKANEEKTELAKLAKTDPQRYLREIRQWTIDRARKLQEEGWRKAQETVEV